MGFTRMLRQTAGFTALVAVLLFGGAGTLDWGRAWVFLGLFGSCSLAFGWWLGRFDPALLAERQRSPFGPDQHPRDRAIMLALAGGFVVWCVAMGLDARRFGWSHVPGWLAPVGAALVVGSFLGWRTVMRANSFAGTRIRVQTERGHAVISSGPYAVVRHPMYSYALPMAVGAPLLLGSAWGVAFVAVLVPLLAARIRGEEAQLMTELPGYPEYTEKVRSRLIPGVW